MICTNNDVWVRICFRPSEHRYTTSYAAAVELFAASCRQVRGERGKSEIMKSYYTYVYTNVIHTYVQMYFMIIGLWNDAFNRRRRGTKDKIVYSVLLYAKQQTAVCRLCVIYLDLTLCGLPSH